MYRDSNFDLDAAILAIREANGDVDAAARACHVNRATFYRWCGKHMDLMIAVKTARHAAREAAKGLAAKGAA